eukprot:52020-Amphidinium_carterae.1
MPLWRPPRQEQHGSVLLFVRSCDESQKLLSESTGALDPGQRPCELPRLRSHEKRIERRALLYALCGALWSVDAPPPLG